MNDTDYATICSFVLQHSGIALGDTKGYLVESRLVPVADKFGYADLTALANALAAPSPQLRDAVIDAMTTNESYFFRDQTPFAMFEQIMLPGLARARNNAGRLRIWCAAASTGQEPYSLAMQLAEKRHLWAGLSVEIIATDLSTSALNRAKRGRYTQFEVQRGLPIQLLLKYFSQDGTDWTINDAIKSMVKFSAFNLLDPMTSIGTVDIIFCRNVLIYFELEMKQAVLEKMRTIMRPDGYLVLGAAETMMGITDGFTRIADQRGLYQPNKSAGERLSA